MCGIVGYIGTQSAPSILVDGLRRLEYRGYDSAGLAVISPAGLRVARSVGKLSSLEALLGQARLEGVVGIGHTRWATHGRPSVANAHPHSDCRQRLAVVHNGIIENYVGLKARLISNGHVFRSETDTEVAAHLIEEKLTLLETGRPVGPREELLLEAVRSALVEVRGAYALVVVCSDCPRALVAAKTASPLAIGLGSGEVFLASDVPAFIKHTRQVVFLEDGEVALVTANGCRFSDLEGRELDKRPTVIGWDAQLAEKAGYRHFMLKETFEQPDAVANTLRGRLMPLHDGILAREAGLRPDALSHLTGFHIVACGTAYHAGIVGKYLLERHAHLPAQVETASEFRYREPHLTPGTLVIAISQSGETADTLAAARLAREKGAKVLAICNTVGSALTRLADHTFYTQCGPECGVASTKAFIGQLVALNIFTLHLALALDRIDEGEAQGWIDELMALPDLLRETLRLDPEVRELASRFSESRHFLFIGRTLNYPTAVEAALKLKEISYIHAEGYPAGEMKHGPLALVDAEMPVAAIATHSPVFEKMVSNIEEAKARGARLIVLASRGETRLARVAEHILELPRVSETISPIINIIPLQLLAYHIANLRGCDVDQPRNLAKSVTVE